MKLYDIISKMKFLGIKNYQEQDIDTLSCDTNERVNNGMYFCIKGLHNDGHELANKAIENGNVCLVVERYLDLPNTQILVENSRRAMSYVSSVFYSTYQSNMKFIGITGTNGKTTTTFIIKYVLNKLGKSVGLIGTQGIYIDSLMLPNKLTTPDPIELHKTIKMMEESGCEYCVMEVSAHAIALNKIDDIHYDVVALSNITQDHLDFFKTMDNYTKCKESLFDINHTNIGVINTDDMISRGIFSRAKINKTSVGHNGNVSISNLYSNIKGSNFMVEYEGESLPVHTNLIGSYNVDNVALAIGVLLNLKFNLKDIVDAISSAKIYVPGRFNLIETEDNFSVVIDYAHTPDGMKNILSTIYELPKSRLITVFGCGGNRDKGKRPKMLKEAMEYSDVVIVTSDNPRDENPDAIIDDILEKETSSKVRRITDRQAAIEYALTIARANDIIAILGKGAETYQEIKGVKHYFSDYDVVDNFFKLKDKNTRVGL